MPPAASANQQHSNNADLCLPLVFNVALETTAISMKEISRASLAQHICWQGRLGRGG